ncbi:MAG: MarR family transcriptional regulator [Rhodospirillales bacterium]|nr:MAG: MarR family transcriptional regulator [Rhodospirillales bacterium]
MPRLIDRGGACERLELDLFLPYRLSVLQQEVSRLIATAYAEKHGLTRHDWRVMAALGSDQPLTANDVCSRTNMDKVQVSRAIARLLGRGLVVRAQDAGDRRRWSLQLTPRGEDIYRDIVPAARRREAELLDGLSEAERRRLHALIDKLYRRACHLTHGDG